MLRIVVVLLLGALPLCSFAHNGHLKGVVKDRETNEPLAGANVYVREISAGTTTDIFGRFQLTMKPGNYVLKVSYVGFRTEIISKEIVEHETGFVEISLNSGALQLSDLVVSASPIATKTSHLSAIDIRLRPVNSSHELLRMVPGLFIAQHAGGGKAEQIFLRGFDIDHGTDINLTVDGMPVNMVSHAHGQGYSDLHFLIPETIESIDFGKGPHQISKGNFATAGYASFNTFSTIEDNSVKLEGGSFGIFRNVNMIKLLDRYEEASRKQLYVVSEFFRSDGYFDSPQDFHRVNGMVKYYSRKADKRIFKAGISLFNSSWSASGQIPVRAVESGSITRFGAIDAGEGGETSRYNVNASLTHRMGESFLDQNIYLSRYDFDLLSNFTFFLNDPVNGDRILQRETRHLMGYNASYTREYQLHTLNMRSSIGAGFRYDVVDDVELSRVIDRQNLLGFEAFGDVNESNVFAYADHTLTFPWRLSVKAGLRIDHFSFQYADHLNGEDRVSRGIISPKLSLEYDATRLTRFFVKASYGFHSNDSRAIIASNTSRILPRAIGVDVGTQWKPFPGLFIESALWLLELEDELVYVGDEGIVEPSGATRRKGVEVSMRYQMTPSLYGDLDMTYTIARSTETDDVDADYIPLAPSFTTTGGILYKKERFDASLRARYLADRPANEDNSLTATGFFLADVNVSYNVKKFTFGLSAENVLNNEWREAQFETTSRLAKELEPSTEIHFTPGSPRTIKASVRYQF